MLRTTITLAATVLFISLAVWAAAPVSSDSIKGDWNGIFSIAGHTADVSLTFGVDGDKLTGTVSSEHTGPGTVTDGTFKNGKLSCTLKFEKHESINLSGELVGDKLSGSFATEGMTGTWSATRKN